jgi:hypothetical protein
MPPAKAETAMGRLCELGRAPTAMPPESVPTLSMPPANVAVFLQ